MSDQTILRVTFVSESAAYQNTFGWYNSSTGVGGVLFADVDSQGSGALTPGVSYVDFAVNTADLGKIQFFLIPDGAAAGRNAADDLSGTVKVIKLSDGTWAVADADANGNVIYNHGKPDLLTGAGANALFTETSKNAGGVDYASSVAGSQQPAGKLAGDTADGATGTIAWEDTAATRRWSGSYTAPGDADYNDAVFQVSIVQKPVANADAVTVGEDAGPAAIDVLANDTNPASGPLRVTSVDTLGILGTVSIAADGHNISYAPGAAFQSLRAGQTATETFTYTVTNSAGQTSTATTTVTIQGANDAAVIGTPSAADVTEDTRNSTLKLTGTIAIADVDQGESSFRTTVVSTPGNLGTLSLKADGSYTYSIANGAVQYLGAGETRVETFTVAALDGTTKQVSFTVHGTNDAAVIGSPTVSTVTEDASAPTLSVSGTISIADADQNQAAFQAGVITAPGNLGALTLNADGSYGYSVANSAVQYLGRGDTKVETFTVKSLDGTAKQVSFVIKGVNDAPVIGTPTVHDVYDNPSALVLTASGSIGITDADQGEAAFKPSVGFATGNLGFLLLAKDGSYVYVVAESAAHNLAAGTVKVDTFTVTAVDGTTKQVSFTVHGPAGGNNEATIGDPTIADVTENVAEDGAGNLTAQGTISVSDSDAGQSSFQTSVAGQVGNLGSLNLAADGSYTYTVADAAVQYLGEGDTKVDTFTVTSQDGTSKDVMFTIHGTNDVATFAPSSSEDTAVTEAGGFANALAGDLNASGQLTVHDLDGGQDHFVSPASLAGAYGDFTFDAASGVWSYTLDQAKSESLAGGQNATDTLTVASDDGTTHDIVVDIAGANDAPGEAVFTQANDALLEGSVVGTVVGSAVASDPDSGDTLTYSLVDDNGATYTGPLAIDPHSGVVTVSGNIDFESTEGLLTAVVRTTDQGNLHSDKVISVVVGDQLETTASAIEGYIANATIFVDDDGDGVLSSGDFVTHSDSVGNFQITGSHSGAIYLLGGPGVIDTATGLQFNGILRAAPGSTVLSPLTTLIAAIADQNNGDFDAAKALVAAAFDVPAGVDLNTFDPLAAAVSQDSADQTAGAELFAAGVQLYNAIVQGASLIAAAGDVDTQAAANAMLSAIVEQVSAGTLNLSDESNLTSVINAAAGIANTDVTAIAADAASVIAGSNTLIDNALAPDSGLAGTDLLQSIAGTATVAQGAAAQALGAAAASGDTSAAVSNFTATNLQNAVDAATANVDTNALLGPAGDNILTGTSGADALDGAGGNDQLHGEGGKDILIGGSGNDLLDGGQGFDRAIYSDATGGITVDLADGTAFGAGVGTDTLVDVESIVGSDFADTFDATGFTGDAHGPGSPVGYNEFEGRGGDDTIISSTNSQSAELTRVSYVSATGAVTVDLAAGYAQGDASVGHDTLVGSGFNGVWGSAYDDTILGSNNPMFTAEVYAGFAGNDFIDGRGGYDRVDYNVDPATATGITVNLAAGIVSGDATVGTDTLRAIEAIRGTNFADTYNAVGFGPGSLNAGSNGMFNEFTGNGGDDVITGNGFTRLGFNNATASVTVDFVTGIATSDSSVGTDHFSGVNAVQASMFDDTLLGGATNDTFTGLAGNDWIDGRGGFDVSSYNNIFFTTGGITVNMAAGIVTGEASNGTDTLRSIEGIQGTNFADTYDATGYGVTGANTGNNGTFNQFEGLAGDDVITGNGSTRLIFANATGGVTVNLVAGSASGDASTGHDSFTGVNSATGSNFADVFDATGFSGPSGTSFQGLGGDDQIIGNGTTQLQYNSATSGVIIDLAAGTASGDGSVGHDSFSGVNSVLGGNFNDVYDATGFAGVNANFNSFQGNAGNDTITGNGNTQIQYGSATSGVTVNLSAGTADGDASVGYDTITGGVSGVFGSNFNDTIIGSAGNDGLSGSNGNDVLDGRAGNDFLSGGAGADTFVYASGGGFDFIQDFAPGQDKIDLSGVYGIYSLSDLQAHAVQSGPNTVISIGAGEGLTLQNVALSSLVASDFLFGTPAAPIVGDDDANNLVGTANAESISGLGGNDRLQGLGGSDLLDGGLGFDRAIYTDATGGVSVDLAAGTVSGPGVGTDTLVSIEGVVGSDFADTFDATGFSGASGIPGASVGLAEFEGRGGDDVIIGSTNASGQILGRVSYASATSGVTVDIAAGIADGDVSVGHDTFSAVNAVVGSAYADTLRGSDNPGGTYEQYDARGGNDLIDGRGGYDFATYNSDPATTAGISVNLAAGTVTGDASTGTDTLRSVEGVRGTAFADTYDATGFSGVSTNPGSLGTFNNFEGMGGDDQITGNGNTRLQFSLASDDVTVDIAAGTSHGTAAGDVAQIGTDTFTGVNAVMGSLFADSLSGSAANETFQGLAGDDTIDGRGGFDTAQYNNLTYTTGGVSVNMASGIVTGDASIGTDTLRSIEGVQGTIFADTYDATGFSGGSANAGSFGNFNQFEGSGGDDHVTGNGNTRLLFTNAGGGVTVNLGAGSAIGDVSVGHDTFTGVNSIYGSNFADAYDAGGFVGFNSFQGLGGNDLITGNGSTQLLFANATGGVTVDLASGTVSGDASVGHDTITGGVNSVSGSAFNDTLKGSSSADMLIGNGGADTFVYVSGGGADVVGDFSHAQADKIDLSGVAGIYTLADVQAVASQQGANTFIDFGNGDTLTLQNVTPSDLTSADFIFSQGVHLVGDADPNTLVGTAFADVLSGLDGNDRLQGLGANDQLDGGLGFDRAIYTDATGGVSIDLAAGTAAGSGVGTDTLVDVEGAVGSDFADTFNAAGFTGLTGQPGIAAGQSEFEGRGGDDLVTGGLNALGQAVTRLSYLDATSAVTVDIAAGTAAGDASVGHDSFSNVSTIWASAFDDTIYGSDNAAATYETYEGRGGDDYIDGRGGYDQVTYNSDTATTSGIVVHLAAGIVNGDATVGTDTLRNVEAARGTNFDDTFDATGFGQAGAVNIGSLGAFNDFAGAGGNDIIHGNGSTRLNYQIAAAGVSVDLETSAIGTTNAVTVAGSATGATEGTDTFTGVNAVQGSTFADTLLGSSFNNNFTGLGGDDYIDGRSGFDVAVYNSLSTVTGGVTVDMAAGTASGDASIGTDTLRSIEGIQGTGYADTYVATGYGQAGAFNIGNSGVFNQFEGLGGDDVITGNGATRLIYANATGGVTINLQAGTANGGASVGHDAFTGVNSATGSNFADVYDASGLAAGLYNAFQGQGGDDTVIGNGSTQIQFANATSGVTINLAAGTASGDASTGHDSFSGVNSAVGGNGDDVFDATGFAGFNAFQGGSGNDVITGNGVTQIQYGNATSGVTVDLAAGTTDGDGSVGHDTITAGVTNVTGSNLNDTITGSGGNDQLFGNNGNDMLDGGEGDDVLGGGFGADTFVYASGGGIDIVGDFLQAQADKIDLTGVPGISSFAQVQALATQVGPNTVLDFGNGDSLTLNNVALSNLAAADFILGQGVSLTGDENANTLTGTAYADSLSGAGGNDKLLGLGGNDLLDGGQGFDRADYTDATGGITANLAAGSVAGPGVGTDVLANVEGIVGSDYADTFDATGFAGDTGIAGTNLGFNEFEGRGGNDTMTGATNGLGALLTRISYAHATGSVTVDLAAHSATGDASVGTDTLVGSGFAGVVGSGHDDQLLGSANGAGTVEIFEGRAGNDLIDGRAGFDRADYALDPAAVGGINVQLALGIVTGDAATVGTDTLKSVESVRGSTNTDTYDATGFNGTSANAGSNGTFNEFIGMGGNDVITGNGNTRISFTNATGAVTVNLQTGSTPGTGSAMGDPSTGNDTFTGVNAVMASMFNDTIYGSNNTAATETFTGLAGDDFIDGRSGFDVVSYNNIYFSTGPVTIDFTAGTATGDDSIGNDTFRGIEGAQGTTFNDVFTATNFGAAGFQNAATNNVGNNGNFNQFEGLAGNDTITGNGNTRVIYASAADAVTINLQAGTATGGSSIGADTYTGVNSATGSNQADTYNAAGFVGLFGTFNLFEGLLGNDVITGNGNTRVSYAQASGGGVSVNLSTGAVSGAAGADVIMGGVNSVQGSNQVDTLVGSTNDEFFFGGGGGDTINAGGGNDGITGQGGNDAIDGGAGSDMVIFTGAQSQYTITMGATIQVQDNIANRDGTDSLTNVEVLQFNDAILLLSSGVLGSPIDISTQQLAINAPVIGTAGDDYLRVSGNIFGHEINLGAGAADTVLLNGIFGNGYTLNLTGVENLVGSNSDEFVNLTKNADGLVVDLGGGNDHLTLAGGANTLSLAGVESIAGSDFGAAPGVNDVLTLSTTVTGLDISLGNGDNTMNLAAGANSFVNIYDVNHVNGTVSDDILTVTGAIGAANGVTIDLGGGDDTVALDGNYASFAALGIEHVTGNAGDNSLSLTNNVSGIAIAMGDGNDFVSLANGVNSLSISGVENLNGSDFTGNLNPSDDTVTLLNDVSGVTVNLGEGTANVLNLAAGSNSFDNLWNVNLLNGSSSDDTVTLNGSPANVIDLGDGNDTLNLNANVYDITVANAENINASANFDRITIGNTSGNTTITAGAGADEIFASAGHDNFRFVSTADSAAGAADTIHNFDADNDSFTFSGLSVAGGHIEYVDGAALLGADQASAHLQNGGPGNDYLQIDIDGDGTSDMDISLQNATGTLHNGNFLMT